MARPDEVKEVWQIGDTLGTLAAKLKVSRSTISGVYSRNQDMKTSHPLAGTRPIVDAQSPSTNRNFMQRANRIAEKRRAAEWVPPELSDQPGEYTVLTVPNNGCRWPHGDRNITFCGMSKDERGGSYCTRHAKMAYVPREERLARRKV